MTEIRDQLVRGYQSFRRGTFGEQKDLYETLGTKGQFPKVLLLSCADSRVDPTDIFDAYPGEMFVVRNVANFMPPRGEEGQEAGDVAGTASAVEFAVKALEVEAIVVMGHESCGGAAGCLNGLGDMQTDYLGKWVSLLEPAKHAVLARDPEDPQTEMEYETVRLSMRNLATYPFVRERMDAGKLELVGAYFSIISAHLKLMGEDGEFAEVPEA